MLHPSQTARCMKRLWSYIIAIFLLFCYLWDCCCRNNSLMCKNMPLAMALGINTKCYDRISVCNGPNVLYPLIQKGSVYYRTE